MVSSSYNSTMITCTIVRKRARMHEMHSTSQCQQPRPSC